jgi:hypothetical protein
MRRTTILLLVALLAAAIPCVPARAASGAASGFRITGTVVDRLTRCVIPNARVFVDEIRQVAVVDSSGTFRCELPKPGTYRLRATAPQYEMTEWKPVRVSQNKPHATVQIEIDPQTYRVPTVEIYGDRIRPDQPHAPTRTLLASEIRRAPGGFQDPLRAIQESRSVESRNDLGTLLSVRGGETDQILFLMDGFDVYNPYRMRIVLGGGLSLANPDLIESVELYAGGFSARYGNRASGVIQMHTREGNRLSFRSRHTLSLIAASSAFEGPIAGGRGSWIAGFRRTYYDLVLHPPKGEGTQYPYLQEAQGRCDYDVTPDQHITLRAAVSDEGMDMLFRGENPSSEDVQTDGSSTTASGSIEHVARISGKVRASTRVGILGDRSRIHLLGTEKQELFANARTTERRLSTSHEWEISSPPHVTRIGAAWDHYVSQVRWHADSVGEALNPYPFSLDTNGSLSYGAFWVEDVAALRPEWFLSAGMRMEKAGGPFPVQASPRVALRGALPFGHRFLIGAGQFLQYPDGIESFSREAPLSIASLSRLGPERAALVSAGIQGGWKRLHWDVETYQRETNDLHVPLDRTTYTASASGQAFAHGLETELGFASVPKADRDGAWHEGLEIRLAHAWTRSRFRGGIFDRWTPVAAERNHSFFAETRFPLSASVEFTCVLRLASGAPYTPLLSRVQLWDTAGDPYYRGIWGPAFSERTSPYGRVDARFDRDITIFRRRGSLFLEVMNLTNRKNTLSMDWDSELTERRPSRGLPIIPFIGLSVWG